MVPDDIADCALILDPGSPRPDAKIGAAVAAVLGVYRGDAIAAVRYGGGILVRNAPEHTLGKVRDRLSEIGVRSSVVPDVLLSEVARGLRSTRLEFLDRLCWVRFPNRRELPVKRSDFRGLRIHATLDEVQAPEAKSQSGKKRGSGNSRDEAASNARRLADSAVDVGATVMSSRGKQIFEWLRENHELRPRLFLSLYTRDPIAVLRFERQDIDYSVLGDRKQKHSLDNFLVFLEWVLESLPGLWNHESVEAFLTDPDPDSILVSKREEVQNFDAWMQSWIRLQSAAGSRPSMGGGGALAADGIDRGASDGDPRDDVIGKNAHRDGAAGPGDEEVGRGEERAPGDED